MAFVYAHTYMEGMEAGHIHYSLHFASHKMCHVMCLKSMKHNAKEEVRSEETCALTP